VQTERLNWQSRLILALVLAPVAVSLVFAVRFWTANQPEAALWGLGLSALLGLAAWKSRSATPAAAATGALLTASMMLAHTSSPYRPWQTEIIPILAILVLTSLATRFGRSRKEKLGTAEEKHGRGAAQVCANLGFAALASTQAAQWWLINLIPSHPHSGYTALLFAPAQAALAEAAADTVSSEIGQVLGGRPFLLTTLRRVDPGTDGAISFAGTLAGVLAAAILAAAGTLVTHGDWRSCLVIWCSGVFGLLFDSVLGATVERKGWLNNDAVNFLSTVSAAGFTLAVLVWAVSHTGL
jgi:uncharacterized protein (TIGR00297 family)